MLNVQEMRVLEIEFNGQTAVGPIGPTREYLTSLTASDEWALQLAPMGVVASRGGAHELFPWAGLKRVSMADPEQRKGK